MSLFAAAEHSVRHSLERIAFVENGMKHPWIIVSMFMAVILLSFNAHADSLMEISKFSKDICDDIETKGNRIITKTDVKAQLKGKMGKIAKYIGADLGVDGKLTIGKTKEEYEGLPYESISEQMIDSRSCKREISKMLIQERKKVSKRLNKDQLFLRESELKELSEAYQSLKVKFTALAKKNNQIDVTRNLPEGLFNKDGYGQHVKGKLESMGGQMQSMLLMMSFMPVLQEISKGTKKIDRSLKNSGGHKLSKNKEFLSLKNEAQELSLRSQAILFEMLDLVQKRTR